MKVLRRTSISRKEQMDLGEVISLEMVVLKALNCSEEAALPEKF